MTRRLLTMLLLLAVFLLLPVTCDLPARDSNLPGGTYGLTALKERLRATTLDAIHKSVRNLKTTKQDTAGVKRSLKKSLEDMAMTDREAQCIKSCFSSSGGSRGQPAAYVDILGPLGQRSTAELHECVPSVVDSTSSTSMIRSWPVHSQVFALGDLHGDFENTMLLLRVSGLVNEEGHWSGGNSWLIQTGDIVDRGDDSMILYTLFEQLRVEAERAGGRVFQLIGNHEAMNIEGWTQYFSEDEFMNMFNGSKQALRSVFDFSTGHVGKDIFTNYHVSLQVGDTVFVHAGLTPLFAGLHPDELRKEVLQGLAKSQMDEELSSLNVAVVNGDFSPLWTRKLTEHGGGGSRSHCKYAAEANKKASGAKHQVMGHTVTSSRSVEVMCDNSIIRIDTAISRAMGDPISKPKMVLITTDLDSRVIIGDDASTEKYLRTWEEVSVPDTYHLAVGKRKSLSSLWWRGGNADGKSLQSDMKLRSLFTDSFCRRPFYRELDQTSNTGKTVKLYWSNVECSNSLTSSLSTGEVLVIKS